jgi:hypothetical protein
MGNSVLIYYLTKHTRFPVTIGIFGAAIFDDWNNMTTSSNDHPFPPIANDPVMRKLRPSQSWDSQFLVPRPRCGNVFKGQSQDMPRNHLRESHP